MARTLNTGAAANHGVPAVKKRIKVIGLGKKYDAFSGERAFKKKLLNSMRKISRFGMNAFDVVVNESPGLLYKILKCNSK